MSIFHPDAFQGHSVLKRGTSRSAYFEGWYLKHISADARMRFAFIPGIFVGKTESHAFIQILDGSTANHEYIRFPLQHFRAERKEFRVRLEHNQFFLHGMSLDIKGQKFKIQGELNFLDPVRFPVTWTSPGIMGPFAYTPMMQCYHGLVSLNHSLEGALSINGRTVDFTGGKGYIEKDWGRSFPSAYIWMQSNHFKQEASLFASVANIPWVTGSFRGFIAALLLDGKLLRFATYTGATLREVRVSSKQVWITMEDRKYRLEVEAHRSGGAVLMAPYEKTMLERVSETMTASLYYRLSERKGGRILQEDASKIAALEVQGLLEQIAEVVS